MWGAAGWGIAGAISGLMIEQMGLHVAFYSFILLLGVGFFAARMLPISQTTIGTQFWDSLRRLARNRQWAIFLITVLISGMANGVTNNFVFLYLSDLHASSTLMGLSLTAATLSELPIFFFSDRLLKRLGARGLLAVSMAAYILRLVGYAVMPAAWVVLPIHLLHGLTFSAMWVAGVSYANKIAPPGMGATAQGLFTGVTMGLGSASGAFIGGLLYGSIGAVGMFWWMAAGMAAGLLFFGIMGKAPAGSQLPMKSYGR